MKVVKYIFRKVRNYATGTYEIHADIVGKKASIIKLCKEGKLHPRKCRKYKLS